MLKTIARALASQPWIYELIQNLLGRRATWRRIQPYMPRSAGRWLDIGSSSGSFPLLPNGNGEVLDIDILPLLLTKDRRAAARAVVADAARLPFRSRSMNLTTCFAVSHHLDESALRAALTEIARITDGRFLFFDALRMESRLLSRLLWRYDRGAHPRTKDELENAVSQHFEIVAELRYRVAHEYWLAVARPRRSISI